MKPTLLTPGRQYACDGRLMTFVRRDKSFPRPAINVFQCDTYRGLYGPNDDGKCTMNDARVIRHVMLATNPEKGGAR